MSRAMYGLLVVAAVASSGCGYALAGRGSFLPSHVRSIGVPQVENRTAHLDLAQALTRRIREELIGRGRYRVLPDATGADAVLRGEILSLQQQPVGLNDQQLTSRYLLTLVMRVSLIDARNDELLWSNDALTFREEYDLSSPQPVEGVPFVDQQGGSLDRMAAGAARTVVTSIMEAF